MKTASFITLKKMPLRIFSIPENAIALWLFILCGMVFLMIWIGGLTRLTHSGLSITNWQPLSNWFPPLNLLEWQTMFDLYKLTPEYKKVNFGMKLEEFKSIFWLEYIHRLWGKIIGIIFIFPLLFFVMKKWIRPELGMHLLIILALGLLQGFLGWYMVKSGLVDRPDVSQYRLVSHLSLAIIIYCYMLWIGMWLLEKDINFLPTFKPKLFVFAILVAFCVFLTIASGGFVAGIDAGLTYNSFPLMDGNLLPNGLWAQNVWYKNLFEDVTSVQFNHRFLAKVTLVFVVSIWWISRRVDTPLSIRKPINYMLFMACAQFILGVMTLVFIKPILLASLHQLGALILLTFSLWTVYRLKFPPKK